MSRFYVSKYLDTFRAEWLTGEKIGQRPAEGEKDAGRNDCPGQ